ncbi:MAG: hypothetical protein H0W89_05475 [Candidatus Levybacteria bacterium]|nr:hypothetical protein [Candidatus Levybacteria bacterium]
MIDLHTQQEKAVNMLIDWNKWMAGLTFGAATGCIVVLENGVGPLVKMYLVIAIFCFALTLILSSLVFTLLPSIMQQLPLVSKTNPKHNIYDYKPFASIPLRHFITAQFLIFIAGTISLFIWVYLHA